MCQSKVKYPPIYFIIFFLLLLTVSAQDGSRVKKAFTNLDKDKNQKLSLNEYNHNSTLKNMLKDADLDKDGSLTLIEFAGAISKKYNQGNKTTDIIRKIKVGELERRYRIHMPDNKTSSNPKAVIIAFHGGGGNPESMVRLSGLSDKADKEGFIVVYPYGSGTDPERNLTFNAGNVGGYAMIKKINDVAFTNAIIDDLMKYTQVNSKRIYATGISNGGMMAYRVASELSHRIAAIAPVGGPMGTEKCNPTSPVSVIHFHGTGDELAPFNGGKGKGTDKIPAFMRPTFYSVEHSINAWIMANKCQEKALITNMPDKVDDGMNVIKHVWAGGQNGSEVVLYKIINGGHTWPGMEPPAAMLGKSTKDISANDLMWEFFKKHPKK